MKIRFKKFLPPGSTPDGTVYSAGVDFDIESGREIGDSFWLLLPLWAEHTVGHALKPGTDEAEQLKRALIRYGLSYIEQGIRFGWLEFNKHRFAKHVIDDVPRFLAMVQGAKSCEYQKWQGRDLFCRAAKNTDAVSLQTCAACEIPDRADVCGALTHPRMALTMASDGTESTITCSARCQLGHEDVRKRRFCRVGGHSCAFRTIEREDLPRSDITPEQLAATLDFFETTWRLVFDKKERLFHFRSASTIVSLGRSCQTHSDFVKSISDLDDVIKSMKIPDALLTDADRAKEENKGDKTLNRLSAAVRNKVADQDVQESALAAIKKLRTVNELRVGYQHSARAMNIGGALDALGLTSTPEPSAAWDRVRVIASSAFIDLRKAIESLGP